MNSDWLAVIGFSVAVMAVVQVATLVGIFVALRRIQSGVHVVERRMESAIEEFKPQLAHLVDDARAASISAQELVSDLRSYMDSVEETAHSVRQRVSRVVDGVQTAAEYLPAPMKVSGPAAVALWASVRIARTVLGRVRERRRLRAVRERQLQEAESYLGVG